MPAEALDLKDAQLLAGHYAPSVNVEDEVLVHLIDRTNGSARYVSNHLASFEEAAALSGLQHVTLADIERVGMDDMTIPMPRQYAAIGEVVPLKRAAGE